MNRALFLDLDHTLVRPKSGETFPIGPNDWEFLPNMVEKVKHFYDNDYYPIIVTNQGGIETGHTTVEDVVGRLDSACMRLAARIGYHDGRVPYYYCPWMESYDRKPLPGMAYKAALDFNLCLPVSIMIGDMERDKEFAANAGILHFYFVSSFLY